MDDETRERDGTVNKREKDIVDSVGTELFFLNLAVQRNDPKSEILLRIADTKKKLDSIYPNKDHR